jgi:hypothetical protein
MISLHVDITVTESGRRAPQLELKGGRDLDGHISLVDLLDYTKQVLIITADTVLREEQSQGFDQHPVVAVDNVIGKPVYNVNPLGKIDFTARADMGDIVLETYQNILDKSPVLTGQYKSSNYVFLNGTQVATDKASLTAWVESNPEFSESDLIRFVNIEPYARKLERLGVTAQRQQSRTIKSRGGRAKGSGRVLAPNGSYFLTARQIRAKYKRNSIVRFEFIPGSQLGIGGNFAPRRGKPGRAYLYPSILISVQESGIA